MRGKKSMELIWGKIWKRVVKKNRWKKPGKTLYIRVLVKNDEKKLKKANVQYSQIGMPLVQMYSFFRCVFPQVLTLVTRQ